MHHNYAFLWVLLLGQGNEIRFYRGKIRNFGGGLSVSVRISLYMSVSVCLQLQVDAILLGYVFHCHWRQELVAGSYAEHDELVFMA